MASWREIHEEIKIGLEEGKSKNRGLNPKRQAFMTAIRHRHLERVDRLLNQGLDPNFRDASGDFPLHVACSHYEEESSVVEQIVERLVFMGADLEVQDRFSRQPVLVAACISHHLVRILLETGCNVDAQDNAGRTALMEACQNNSKDALETVELLLLYNANVYLKDCHGYTALHSVCQNRLLPVPVRSRMAELLLQAGLSATASSYEGKMALCYELDQVKVLPSVPQEKLQLVELLACAGSNLQHSSSVHDYWLRYSALTVRPQVLLALLRVFAPVLTRPSLRLINRAVTTVLKPTVSKDLNSNETDVLMAEVSRLQHKVDSLQCLCRLSVRAHLRGKLLVAAPQLPLPNKLKAFLTSLHPKPV